MSGFISYNNMNAVKKKSLITSFSILLICTAALCSQPQKAEIFQTSRSGDKFTKIQSTELEQVSPAASTLITIKPDQTFQTVYGIGGAFTESSAWALNQLSAADRQEVLRQYFSEDGNAYSLTRTHINSCDFSLANYSYAPVAGDTALKHFSIQQDKDDLIPLIRDAAAVKGANFKLIASPWTAPPWMKDNNDWNGGKLLPEYYSTWARFFSKYIHAYKENGIDIWAVTVENEPLGNGGQWESMIYSPLEMGVFVKDHLGPRFEKDGIEAKILVYDQNRDDVIEWAEEILGDNEAARYIWGTAVHWYSSTFEWYPRELTYVHKKFPDKKLIHTESCIDSEVPVWQDDDWYWRKEATDWGFDWAKEEDKWLHPKYVPVYRYARDIIGGLNSWLSGWIDWNIVLDDKGGPNHANNWCIAPVIVKPETKEIYYTPLFYVMKHFSRYIRPEAVRIGWESNNPDLMITAVRNMDGKIAVMILNQSPEAFDYQLIINSGSIASKIDSQALQTIVIE